MPITAAMPATTLVRIAALAFLVLAAPIAQRTAGAQQVELATIDLNQQLMDKYLAVQKQLASAQKALPQGARLAATEADAEGLMAGICTTAGFAKPDECASTVAYVGILFSGFNPRTGKFEQPAAAAARRLAELEADTSLPQARRQRAIEQTKRSLTMLPADIPEAHIALMNTYRDRLFAASR